MQFEINERIRNSMLMPVEEQIFEFYIDLRKIFNGILDYRNWIILLLRFFFVGYRSTLIKPLFSLHMLKQRRRLADRCLFVYIDSTSPLLPKSEMLRI